MKSMNQGTVGRPYGTADGPWGPNKAACPGSTGTRDKASANAYGASVFPVHAACYSMEFKGNAHNECVSALYPRDVSTVTGMWRNYPARRVPPCREPSLALYQQEIRMCKLFYQTRAGRNTCGWHRKRHGSRRERSGDQPETCLPAVSRETCCAAYGAQSPTRASGDGYVIVCNSSVAPPKIQTWLAT
jgi:hypothetical protein